MDEKQRGFITLRSDGKSYNEIARVLGVSKPTLIKWGKEFADDIEDMQKEAMQILKEQYGYTQKARYEHLLKLLQKVDEGILESDLSRVSLKDLYLIRNGIVSQIDAIEKTVWPNDVPDNSRLLQEVKEIFDNLGCKDSTSDKGVLEIPCQLQ